MGTSDVDAAGLLRRSVTARFGRDNARALLAKIGFDATHWVRIEAYRQTRAWLAELGVERLDALEIAPGHYWRQLPFRSYASVNFPAYDVCKGVLHDQFDLVIADQVFEHVRTPWRAAANVRAMVRPGGHALIITPMILKVHGYPDDCTRWTENGLRYLLEDAGFDIAKMRSGSWGNRACAVANFRHGWRMFGWGRSLKNDPALPVMSWVLAEA